MSRALSGAVSGSVCLAEQQTSGRGRRGREWVSPFGTNIYLSLYWNFPLGPADLTGLSLAAGIVLAETLESMGIEEIGLKWPNDLLWRSRKLAGLLLEVSGEQGGPSKVVLGLGINTRLTSRHGDQIDQPWVDLSGIPGGRSVGRNQLAGALIDGLINLMAEYGEQGLAPYTERWSRYDLFVGEPVLLKMGNETIEGVHRGIYSNGALLLENSNGFRAYHGGEVSLRLPER